MKSLAIGISSTPLQRRKQVGQEGGVCLRFLLLAIPTAVRSRCLPGRLLCLTASTSGEEQHCDQRRREPPFSIATSHSVEPFPIVAIGVRNRWPIRTRFHSRRS